MKRHSVNYLIKNAFPSFPFFSDAVIAMRFYANVRSPNFKRQIWRFQVRNISAKRWERLGSNMKSPPKEWNLIKKNLKISSLGDYINDTGGMIVRLHSNNANSNLNVNFMNLRLTFHGDAPVAGPGELFLKDRFTFDLDGRFETYDTDMVIVDLFDIESSSIASYANNEVTVVCRFSAGTWENWRPDNMKFDDNAIGNNVDGWPGEKWLDTVSGEVKNLMLDRITGAKEKGCHAVEVVKVNGYAHDTSFDLYPEETKTYILQLATKAHNEGYFLV